jgi:amidase
MDPSSLHYAGLVEVAALIKTGELSPVEIARQMLDRIASVNPSLHAYLAVTGESAIAEAKQAEAEIRAGRYRGPLHGVPIAIKDLFHTRGAPSTFGSLAYHDFVADEDATAVHRLRAAGAVILGRLHLHEGAFGEHHPDLPKCLNPWNSDYWPGGSSSGSGAATAAGLCFASLGTDTGGSIRFPSAANGVTGLKPTWGRTSRYGAFPLAEALDTIGPMARSAADAAAVFDVLAGFDPKDPTSLAAPVPDHLGALAGVRGAMSFRVGVDRAYLETGVDGETVAAIRGALAAFEELGAVIVPAAVPERREATLAQIVITDVDAARFHYPVYRSDKGKFGPRLAAAVERGLACKPLSLATAYVERDRFRGEIARMFDTIDALVSPVYPEVGLRYDEMNSYLADLPRLLGFTSPFNVSGNPTLTMPCGLSTVGTPIGFQLIGPHLSEPSLLRAAHAYQQATDWHTRRPPGF